MTHASTDFAAHVLGLLEKSGPSGPTGPTPTKTLILNEKAGTSRSNEVGPVDIEWSQQPRATGPAKNESDHILKWPGTTGTSGTTTFQQGRTVHDDNPAPAEWHAILAELERQNSPDWLTDDHWSDVLSDTENFLARWGHAAHQLGWTALDLFGVHPHAPASRFDVMGLILLVRGGEAIALSAESASLRRPSGALLRFSRPAAGGVLLSEAAHV